MAKIARYELVRAEAGQADYTFYGGARQLARYKGPEAIIHGPAETGKTLGALNKLHLIACKYPDASIVIARKTLTSCYGTVLQTFLGKVLGNDEDAWPCERYGGEKPEFFTYADTGARIWVAGLDKSSKILSAEHDVIYVNQAEELTLDDWETLTTRTTGRAGHMPYSQMIGDANPSYPAHWMYHRDGLRLFQSRHEENPALFDQVTGEITEQGKRTIAVLDRLTGVRKQRLRYGLPAQAEGAVYDTWSEVEHLLYQDQLPDTFARYVASQDWGYTNPGVLGVWGVDHDGRMYLVAQVYMSRKLVSWWVEQAQRLHEMYRFERLVCDPSEPAYIAEYVKAELPAEAGFNEVRRGIDAVAERLVRAGDGKARLFICRDSLLQRDPEMEAKRFPISTQEEFPAYVWAETTRREEPVKENDHGMDMVRYAVAYVDGLGREPATQPASAPPRTVSREQARQLLG